MSQPSVHVPLFLQQLKTYGELVESAASFLVLLDAIFENQELFFELYKLSRVRANLQILEKACFISRYSCLPGIT